MIAAFALAAVLSTTPVGAAQSPAAGSSAARLTHQSLFGILGSAAGGVAGFFVASAIPCATPSDLCTTRRIYGVIGGSFLGSGALVQLTGHVLGGQGPWWATAIGGATGAATGFLIGTGLNALTGGQGPGSIIGVGSIFVLTIAGGIVGYELGHRAQAAPARLAVVPTAGPGGSGLALLGIF